MASDREMDLLNDAYRSGITSPVELSNFMAQVSHESNGLTHLEESFCYTKGASYIASKVPWSLRDGSDALDAARVEALHDKPERLAELMYGDRMGNDAHGDGYKYRGRGYIQLTGKDVYREAGNALGLDLVRDPELAAVPENAGKIATWYWHKNVHGTAPESVVGATHIINGGENGLADREARFQRWEQALTPQVMQHLAHGEAFSLSTNVSAKGVDNHGQHVDSVLKQGARGEAVEALQAKLGELGYLDNAVIPDSKFGSVTRDAVKAFQHDHHLTVDGRVGSVTHQAIEGNLQSLKQDNLGPLPAVAAMSSLPAAAPGLDDPRNALNPNHALFNELKYRLPDASDNRLLQFTSACHAQGITDKNLTAVRFDQQNGIVSFGATNDLFVKVASVDVKEPSPPAMQSVQHIQQFDQQQVQLQENIRAQIAQTNAQAQPGPVLGGR